jgi:2Fe-2S ferredoxin
MPRIRILPLDVEIEAAGGGTVMSAAQTLGYYWPTTCGGEGRCTTCACEVVQGAGQLEPMGRAERKTLVEERGEGVLATAVRLACQARIRAPAGDIIVVHKPGVRPPLSRDDEEPR